MGTLTLAFYLLNFNEVLHYEIRILLLFFIFVFSKCEVIFYNSIFEKNTLYYLQLSKIFNF